MIAYLTSFALYVYFLYRSQRWAGWAASALLLAGLVMHYFALLERARSIQTVPYDDLYGSMSLFAWLLVATYLGLEIFHGQRSVGAFVTPFVIVWMLIVNALAPQAASAPPAARGVLFALHVTMNILAYSAFALSFILSLIYLLQDGVLRSRRPGPVFWRFPALEVLDRMMRSGVWVGLLALAVGVSLGFVQEHRLNGRYVPADAKVYFTLIIFAIYAIYLGLGATSWRGTRAARLCACNFIVVLFSYTIVNLYFTRFHRFF